MGGFFGVTSKQDCVLDVFFGVDYHSHLGTRRGGMIITTQNRVFSARSITSKIHLFEQNLKKIYTIFTAAPASDVSAIPTPSPF